MCYDIPMGFIGNCLLYTVLFQIKTTKDVYKIQ